MSDLKADWRTLDAGEELDILIVKQLGWEIRSDEIASRNLSRAIIKGEGNMYPVLHFTGVDAFHSSWRDGLIPHFSTDLNAAFTLFQTELGLEWNLFSEDDEWITCEVGHFGFDQHPEELEQATEKTAALAIVKAWLKWQERTDHPAPELKP